MRGYLAVLFLLAAVGAHAEKPPLDAPAPLPEDFPCSFGTVTYDWDFATGPHDFYIRDCDAGGLQVWEYGSTSIIDGAPPMVWGTVLEGPYPNETGSGLVSPTFMVTPTSYLVEVRHYFETEQSYDGCNLVIYPYDSVWHPNGVGLPHCSSRQVYSSEHGNHGVIEVLSSGEPMNARFPTRFLCCHLLRGRREVSSFVGARSQVLTCIGSGC